MALDELGLTPDLVVSGINEGQNLGPVVDLSGTVGAARAAARRGVPALAVSQGFGQDLDYEVAAGLVTDWIEAHADALRRFVLSPVRSTFRALVHRPPPFDTYHTSADALATLEPAALALAVRAVTAIVRGLP